MAERIVKKVIIEVDDNGSLKKTGKDSQTLNRNMKGLSQQSSNASKNFSKQAQGMQGVLVPAYAEVAARVFALSAAYQALSRAADYRILIQGQAEYAKRTGKNMADIAKQVQKAAKGMLGFADASSAVALATTSGIGSAQIVKMTKAAVDSSTALGRSVQDTMDRLTRGIVKAEPEILDEIGVIIRLDQVYKDYAESVQKSTTELTEGEKATARYTAIMGQLETKFGGIADKVDPNYMRSAAASIMDVIATMSSMLTKVFNPVLKFLTESKSAIIVIIAVIIKNLAGKVFPMFTSMGERIAAYPAKMASNVGLLSSQIDVLNAKMAGQRVISADFNSAINKAMPAQYRGAAWNTAGTGAAGQKTKLRSMGASLRRAESQMGKGAAITSGKYSGMTRAQLNILQLEHKALQKEIGKTHSLTQRAAAEGSLAMAKFNKTVAQTKMFFATAAASATQYFTVTKQLIADQGLLRGTWMGLRAIGMEWTKAAAGATLYERALQRVGAFTGMLGVMTAFLGKIISKAFAWLIGFTMILSIGKMVLDMFRKTDTQFMKTAKAAKTFTDEIAEQKNLFDSRDQFISFEGAAESFDDAMKNITFASNFADSLYESTSRAMKVLSVDMKEMGFWDSLIDGMKSLFGRGLIDNMAASAGGTALMMAEAYPKIEQEMRKKYKVSGKILGSGKEYEDALGKYMLGQSFSDVRDATKFSTDDRFDGAEFVRDKGIIDLIREIEEDKSTDKFEKQRQLAQITDDYLDKLETQSKLERARVEDTKALTDAFINLGKATKKFQTGLLSKTGVHDMAVEWKKIDNIMNSDSLRKSTKLLKLREQGVIKGPTGVQAPWMKGNAKDDAFDYIMEQGGMDYLMENWAELDKKLMKTATFALKQERELKELKIFGSSALEEQTQKQQLIAELKLTEKRESLRLLEIEHKKGLATDHDIDQARTKLAIAEKEIKDIGKIALKQAEYRAKLEGRTLSIMEKITALKLDWGDSPFYGDMISDEATSFFTRYIQNLDKSISKQDKLNLLLANFKLMSVGEQGQIRAAQQKALQFSSFAGSGNTFLNHQIINDSMLKGIGENEYKRNRTAELISENPVLKMHKPVIDLYLKVEKLRAKNLDRDLLLQAEKQLIETEYQLALEAEIDAKWKERADVFGGAMKTIADGFGSAISSYFNDIFMNRKPEKGAFRTAIAESFASAGSKMIGDTVQQQVFGRSGVVSGMLKAGGMSDKWLDTLFPKTELELAQERTNLLKEIRDALIGKTNSAKGVVYPGDPNNVVPGGLESLKKLAAERKIFGSSYSGSYINESSTGDAKSQVIPRDLSNYTLVRDNTPGNGLYLRLVPKAWVKQVSSHETFAAVDHSLQITELGKPPPILQSNTSSVGTNQSVLSALNSIDTNTADTVEQTGSWVKAFANMGGQFMGGTPGYGSILRKGPWGGLVSTGAKQKSLGSMVGNLLVQSMFGGFFANGGTLGAGKFGIAGENGPELIHGPAKITPMGAGGNVTVNVAVDANGQSGVTDVSGEGAKELGYLVSQAVQAELVDQQRPGGLLSSY